MKKILLLIKKNYFLNKRISKLIYEYHLKISKDINVPKIFKIKQYYNNIHFYMEKIEGEDLEIILRKSSETKIIYFYTEIIKIYTINLKNFYIIDFKLNNFILSTSNKIYYIDFYPIFINQRYDHIKTNKKNLYLNYNIANKTLRLLAIIIYFIKNILLKEKKEKTLIDFFILELKNNNLFNIKNDNKINKSFLKRLYLLNKFDSNQICYDTLKQKYLEISYFEGGLLDKI